MNNLLLKDIGNEWFYLKAPQIKPSTSNKYFMILNKYIYPSLGDYEITSITKKMVEEYISQLLTSGSKTNKPLSSKTVTDIISVFRSIISYALDCGYPVSERICNIRIKQQIKKLDIISISDQKILLSYLMTLSDLRSLGIILSLFTGLRLGEICALRWENISLDNRILSVRQTMQRVSTHVVQKENDHLTDTPKTQIIITSPKSISSVRDIPLSNEIVHILSLYERKSGYLLTGLDNSYIEPRSMHHYFKKIIRQCGLNDCNPSSIHFHTLRHTFATRCIEYGFDVKTLSEILGHSNVSVTMNRYIHPSMELKRQNMERLDELLSL